MGIQIYQSLFWYENVGTSSLDIWLILFVQFKGSLFLNISKKYWMPNFISQSPVLRSCGHSHTRMDFSMIRVIRFSSRNIENTVL